MNNERRRRIEKIMEKIDGIKVELEEVRDDEQQAFDNLPEGLQLSERGENMENGLSLMEECIENLDSVAGTLEEVILP